VPRNPFKRAVDLPAEVLGRVQLGKGEKVLAGTRAADGTWLLGTPDALLLVEPSPMSFGRSQSVEPGGGLSNRSVETRIPWQRVEMADWDREAERLTLAEVGEFGQVRPEYAFEIADPGLLLELIRERVTSSVVLQRRVVVSGKAGLFVVARRPPRGDGEITWAYEFDPGVSPEDPAVIEAARRGLETATEELGL